MLFLTGADGVLGGYLRKMLQERGLALSAPTRNLLDVTDAAQCRNFLADAKPDDSIVHCAAMIDWEECHNKAAQCFTVNAVGTWNIAKEVKNKEAQLVYISTDGVFNGRMRKRAFTERDVPSSPPSIYGISKLMGEYLAGETRCRLLIIRIGWLFGGDPTTDRKFIGTVLRRAAQQQTIKAVSDKIGTLAYLPHVSERIYELAVAQKEGTRHLANKGIVSRYGIAKELSRVWGFSGRVTKSNSSEFPSLVRRPDFSAIATVHRDALLPTWKSALQQYHRQYPAV